MKIVLFGAPSSGKGSQAKLISNEFGLPQISTGDILRDNIQRQTEIGKFVESIINRGELVPDNIMIEIIKERINEEDCKNGYILDGFPRTLEQAKMLLKITNIDVVIYIDVSIIEVERRALSRRICPACGKIYNISNKFIENCDDCGAKLIQRDDDKIDVIRHRIEKYLSQSESLIEFFRKKKLLKTVFSAESPEETYKSVRKILLKI